MNIVWLLIGDLIRLTRNKFVQVIFVLVQNLVRIDIKYIAMDLEGIGIDIIRTGKDCAIDYLE